MSAPLFATRWRSATALGLVLALGVGGVALAEISAPSARHAEQVEGQVAQQLQAQPTEAEKARVTLIEEAVRGIANEGGAWERAKGRKLVYINLGGAATQALANNLTRKTVQEGVTIAEAAVQEARAAFDPVFNVSVSYNNNDTYDRMRVGLVNEKTYYTNPRYMCVEGNPINGEMSVCSKRPERDSPAIVAIGHDNRGGQRNLVAQIHASTSGAYDATESLTYTVTINQRLPWGPQLTLSHVTLQKPVYYRDNYYYEDGSITSNLYLDFSTPLPFTAGFGASGSQELAIRTARAAQEAAQWQVKSTVNSLLYGTAQAYWSLVQALEGLYAAQNNYALILKEKERVDRAYERELATEYNRAQMDAEVALVRIDLENARSAYLAASETLAQLIDSDPAAITSTVYVPVAFTKALAEDYTTTFDKAWATALEHRPAFKLAATSKTLAQLTLEGAENRALPDVTVSANLGLRQLGDKYGYRDLFEANQNLFRPDVLTHSYALRYRYVLGEEAKEAAVETAKLSVRDAELAAEGTEAEAQTEIRNALVQLEAARAQAAHRAKEVQRLQAAYDGLQRKSEMALVTQHEIIVTARQLLSAAVAEINARTAVKTAEAALLAAQGILPNQFGEAAAVSDADRQRLRRLAEMGLLDTFKPVAGQQTAAVRQ